MTRQEAIEKYSDAVIRDCENPEQSGHIVDALVALGVLKLEEPKSVEERVNDALLRWDSLPAGLNTWDIKSRLKAAGLRIVDARSQGEG